MIFSPEHNPESSNTPKRSKASNLKWRNAELDMLRREKSRPKPLTDYNPDSQEDIKTEASPERILELEQHRNKMRGSEETQYHGPSPEELTRRNILIKSTEMDRKFIISKKIFIQELFKQGTLESLREAKILQEEVENLEAKLLVDREKVKESIISVIDELEETTPGLKQTLATERKLLEMLDRKEYGEESIS